MTTWLMSSTFSIITLPFSLMTPMEHEDGSKTGHKDGSEHNDQVGTKVPESGKSGVGLTQVEDGTEMKQTKSDSG